MCFVTGPCQAARVVGALAQVVAEPAPWLMRVPYPYVGSTEEIRQPIRISEVEDLSHELGPGRATPSVLGFDALTHLAVTKQNSGDEGTMAVLVSQIGPRSTQHCQHAARVSRNGSISRVFFF